VYTNIRRIRLQVEAVTEEVLPSRARTFPDAFVKSWAKTEWEEIGIAAEVVKLGAVGMGGAGDMRWRAESFDGGSRH